MNTDNYEQRSWKGVFSRFNFLMFLGGFLLLFSISTNLIVFGQNSRSITYSDITIDHGNEEIRIAVNEDTTILYCDSKKLDWMEAITILEEDKYVAVIDTSWINRSKEFVLGIKDAKETSDSKMIKISLAAREEGLKAGFSGEAAIIDKVVNKPLEITYPSEYVINSVSDEFGYVYFYTGSGYTARYYEEYNTIEWKNGADGTWREFEEFNPGLYANKGATIYFRVKASANEKLSTTVNNQGIYVTKGAPAGKEVRLTYAKLANAPKIMLDTSKLTVALRAGYEYRILPDGEWINVVDAHLNTQGKVVPISLYNLYMKYDVTNNLNNKSLNFQYQDFNMEIRIAATAKKTASKTFHLKVSAPNATESTGIGVSYVLPYNKDSGILFSNTNPDSYQIALISGKYCGGVNSFDASKVNYAEVKWYTVKSGTKEKPSSVKIPGSAYTGRYEVEEPILIYRLAPIKESKTQEQVIASKAIAVALPIEVVQSATDSVQSKVELVQGTVTEGKIEVSTTNVSVGAIPKMSTPKKPSGVTITADKVKADGKFTITVKISSTAQVVDSYKFTVTIEGLKKEYTVVIKEKPATPSPTPTVTPTETPTPTP